MRQSTSLVWGVLFAFDERSVNGVVYRIVGVTIAPRRDAPIVPIQWIARLHGDGITKMGNRFLVIRRGDAYTRVMRPGSNVGQDDEDFPARAIGEILVVQTGEQVSMGFVSFAIHEFGVGDRIFMRKGQ